MHRHTREIPEQPRPAAVLRAVFGACTVMFAVGGFLVDGGGKLYAASGVCGVLWWGWDLLVEHVFTPLEYWMDEMLAGGTLRYDPLDWSVDDRLARLEDRMATGGTRRLRIHAAIRVAEIYRLQKKDETRARQVIEAMRARYPDAPELQRFLGDD